jgi:hypothetical protein
MKTANWIMWVTGILTIAFPGLVFFGLITADQSEQLRLLIDSGMVSMTGLNLATLAAFLMMVSGALLVFAKPPQTTKEATANVKAGWMTTFLSVTTLLLMALVMFNVIDMATRDAILLIINDTFANIVSGDLLTTLAAVIGGVGQILLLFVKDPKLAR